jgi:hypothetical protein
MPNEPTSPPTMKTPTKVHVIDSISGVAEHDLAACKPLLIDQDFSQIEARLMALIADHSPDLDVKGNPRNTSMRDEFATFYGGTQPMPPPVETGRRKH